VIVCGVRNFYYRIYFVVFTSHAYQAAIMVRYGLLSLGRVIAALQHCVNGQVCVEQELGKALVVD